MSRKKKRNQSRPPQGRPALFLLEPMDSWFFRDGRPFDARDPAQMPVSGFFPPMPQTAIGAVRAAVALALGWNGRCDWSEKAEITEVVGSGEDLAALANAEVFLVQRRQQMIEALFAAPHVLFGEAMDGASLWRPWKPWKKPDRPAAQRRLARLRPSNAETATDIGLLRLPELATEHRDWEPLTGSYWLTAQGMDTVLSGGVPAVHENSIVAAGDVFDSEARIGIAVDPRSGSAATGMLYRVSHTRPRRNFAVAVATGPLPSKIRDRLPSAVPFGGEGRMAWITLHDSVPRKPGPPGNLAENAQTKTVRYTVTLASPAELPEPWPLPGQSLGSLPGTISSACLDRAVPVAGWMRGGGAFGARNSRAVVPAGATWFLEAPAAQKGAVLAAHGTAIGERPHWGMGRILIGTWS